jgi:tetratricopeptide (TPR) repeat protein
VLFVVWANLDRWFVLGLATVALVWLGQVLDEARGAGGPQGSWLPSLLRRGCWLLLLAAACLINPAHVHAFALPPELGSAAGSVQSPFQRAYFATLGLTPASLAYFPLLGLSLLSFFLNLPRWSWRRFLPWLGLALVSAAQARAVPFFAVVAGPVLAWNLQEFLARQHQPAWQPAFAAGRLLTGLLLVGLPAVAWPGWLQSPPFEPRRWAVEVPASLERGAASAGRALQEGKFGPGGRGLHLAADSANVFAWFCPDERGLRDDRLAAALRGDEDAPADWAGRMRAAGIDHVVLYDTDRGRLFATLGRLLEDPRQWPLLDVQGYLVVLGWRDPAAGGAADPFRGRELDLQRRAFRSEEVRKAPAQAPDRRPEPRPWWEAYWKPVPPRPVDQDEATVYLFQAEAWRTSAPRRRLDVWERGQLAGLIGAAGTWAGPADLLGARLHLALSHPMMPRAGAGLDTLPIPDLGAIRLQGAYARQQGDIPPALLYLAVRAARRALAANPDDAQAYLVLGESYLQLLHSTRELAWGDQLSELVPLRQVQASAALNQAVSLRPDLAPAHFSLSGLYREMGYLDLALEHWRAYVRLMRQAGPPAGVTTPEFRDQLAAWEDELRRLEQEVDKRQNRWEVASANRSVLARASRADKEGLAGKARDLLMGSNIAAFGPPGMALELQLLLRTGRPRLVCEWTGPEQEAALGVSYHWLRTQAWAAAGDYFRAKEECQHLSRMLASGPQGQDVGQARQAMALLAGKRILDEPLGEGTLGGLFLRARGRFEFRNRVNSLAQTLRREQELRVFWGLLALEEGEVDDAEIAFRQALSVWKDAASAESGAGMDFSGRVVAQECLEWLE